MRKDDDEKPSGRGRLLLIEAPAGLGKSALLERGVRIAREAGLLV